MEKEANYYNKQKALRYSTKEGSASAFSSGISNAYVTPFALKLSQSEFYIGLLSSLSGLAAPISQIFGSRLMRKYDRKSIFFVTSLWQAILWLPLCLLAIFRYLDIFQSTLIYFFILFYTIIVALGGISYPAWFSWTGDLVNEEHKGRYFAKRNTIAGIADLLSVIIGGVILRLTQDTSIALISFAGIFFASFISKLFALNFIKKTYIEDTEKIIPPQHEYLKLIRKHKKFKIFAYYNLFLYLAIFFSSPFFAVYMLSKLHFDYLTFMAITLSGSVYYVIFNKSVGKFSDKYGNAKLLVLANMCFAFTPILWVFSSNPLYLILVPGLFTGIANSALTISINNYTLDALKKKHRGAGIALMSLFSGAGIFIGSILGGLALEFNLNVPGLNKYLLLFVIGFTLRAAVAFIFVPIIKEIKKTKALPPTYVPTSHPFKFIKNEIHGLGTYINKRKQINKV